MINQVDSRVKTVVKTLKQKGMWENTLLLVFSDHGGPVYPNN